MFYSEGQALADIAQPSSSHCAMRQPPASTAIANSIGAAAFTTITGMATP